MHSQYLRQTKQDKIYVKKSWNRFQKPGRARVLWNVESSPSDIEDVEILSNVSGISTGFSLVGECDGVKTTDGIRWCFRIGASVLIVGRNAPLPNALLLFLLSTSRGGGSELGFVGSHSKPGLTIRLTVSPSFTLYSLSNFVSARAFPLSKRRCASTGGELGWDASLDLMSEMVSVGCTERVNDLGGFKDLNVTLISATETGSSCLL
jgi:hypothetical protein